jgi:mono/diheme cytochrome c family protein
MKLSLSIAAIALCVVTQHAFAAQATGDVTAGKDLFVRSCSTCHAQSGAQNAADTAPPLSFMARDSKDRPAFIRGWLMDPHPPMPGIMLSRQQINDIIAYLNSVPSN